MKQSASCSTYYQTQYMVPTGLL